MTRLPNTVAPVLEDRPAADAAPPGEVDGADALVGEGARRVEALRARLAERDRLIDTQARALADERARHDAARLEADGARAGLEMLHRERAALARSRSWRATAPARWLAWMGREWRRATSPHQAAEAGAALRLLVEPSVLRRACLIGQSGWFDEACYRQEVPGLGAGRLAALRHYVREGAAAGLAPHWLFDAAWYTGQASDIPPGMSPLVHWILRGQYDEASPHPLFDQLRYLRLYPDVAASRHAPLAHYLACGWREGRSPHALFDVGWYLDANPDVRAAGVEPLTHYLAAGWRERRAPHPLFDPAFYLARNPDVARAGAEPLTHYVRHGAREGRSPHRLFDTAFYLEAYPDVGSADALRHYLQWGWRERRHPHRGFDPAWYESQYLAGREVNPLLHFVTEGEAAGHAINRWRLTVPAPAPAPPATRPGAPRALVLDACTPTPDRDAGSAAAFAYMRLLCELGWDVTFVPVDNYLWFGPYTQALEQLGITCLDAPRVGRLDTWLDRQGDVFDLVMLWRLDTARDQLDTVRAFCPRARTMFVTVDLSGVRLERQARLAGDPVGLAHAHEIGRQELAMVDAVDLTVAISDVETGLLRQQRPGARVRTLPIASEVPGRRVGYAARCDLAFIGGYRHPPNVDAVRYFVETMWPGIRQRLPDARFHIVGADAPPALRAIAADGVVYRGHVPDLGDVLDHVRLTVAPLRFGAGQKGKVVSSLGAGVPCVLTTMAAEGMGLVDGTHALVRDEPTAFVDAVVRLYEDEATWTRLSDAGLDLARQAFSLDRGREALVEALDALGLQARPGAGATSC